MPDPDDIADITARDLKLLQPGCTREILREAIWAPTEPHVLVTHDASRLKASIPTSTHMPLPWICTYKAARHVWPGAPGYTLNELVEWRGLCGDDLPASTQHSERAGVKALAIGALLTDLLRSASLNQLLTFSMVITASLVPPPLPDDEFGWSLVPDDNLHWFAAHAINLPDYVRPRARAEKFRRVSQGGAPHIRFDPPSLPD